MIGVCGKGVDVYALCFAYFAIMFSTRNAFDVYTSISGANGVLHLIAFCFYGMGVFIMTLNISSHQKSVQNAFQDDAGNIVHSMSSSGVDVAYGSCERSVDYDIAFGIAFIFTRVVLVTMYGLYFFVFHESNTIGLAPEMGIGMRNIHLSDLTKERDSDLEAQSEMSQSISTSVTDNKHNSMDSSRNGSLRIGLGVDNPLMLASNPNAHRSSFVMRMTSAFRESAVKKHFARIFALKVSPLILSSIIMVALLGGASPVYTLPVVAAVEFVGDFLPSYFVTDVADWRELNPNRYFAQERLGLFFMLVLGEAVLGFSAVSYDAAKITEIYKILL